MRYLDGDAVDAALSYPALVDVLQTAFKRGAIAPLRHHHAIALQDRPEAALLLMPAWETKSPGAEAAGRYAGVKTVTVFPDNARLGKPAVFGTYVLLSAETGETVAIMDATRLTAWRTGAASALASRYLSRSDASRLLMIGSGALAPQLIRAHASVRPIRSVAIWNRTPQHAAALARALGGTGLTVETVDDLESAVRCADIVSAATISAEPLIRGAWVQPGTHVDCVGAYRPSMRETDDEVVRRASIFVDSYAGAFSEAGDIVQPLQAGVIKKEDVRADLFELTRGEAKGRTSAGEITFFKSVGAAIEDLAAAIAVYEANAA